MHVARCGSTLAVGSALVTDQVLHQFPVLLVCWWPCGACQLGKSAFGICAALSCTSLPLARRAVHGAQHTGTYALQGVHEVRALQGCRAWLEATHWLPNPCAVQRS